MKCLDLADANWETDALAPDGPTCLIIQALLKPVAGLDRFQPTKFPEIGHVVYDAPHPDGSVEKVCIVDSPASMANHLETVCLDGPAGGLHPDLAGLPYVRCMTDEGKEPSEKDSHGTLVCTTLTEGHRLASDYFLDGLVDVTWQEQREEKNKKGESTTIPACWAGTRFRDKLRTEMCITEIQKNKTYFILPDTWWQIYRTIFKYDPNSLVHGVMFAKEQIKLARLVTSHLEAFGAARVGRSGVKFDRLGKTTSGQPIFAVDDETAREIRATFVIDLALLRSYGRSSDKSSKDTSPGLTEDEKRLLLDLTVWKIKRLLTGPFRFRSGCHLQCTKLTWCDENSDSTQGDRKGKPAVSAENPQNATGGEALAPTTDEVAEIVVDMKKAIAACAWNNKATDVYYPRADLFKPPKEEIAPSATNNEGGALDVLDDEQQTEE